MAEKFKYVLIMGVSGAGKSSIGAELADRMQAHFIEADDHHDISNINKMRAGSPLNDADREAWLIKIKAEIVNNIRKGNVVVACSALKKQYRDFLGLENHQLVYLKVDEATARRRVKNRDAHFMPETLIESQFSALEEPSNAVVCDSLLSKTDIVENILQRI